MNTSETKPDIRHKLPYAFWLANKRSNAATATEYQRAEVTIAKWRAEEGWDIAADAADAERAAQILTAEENARSTAQRAVQAMLDNMSDMQAALRAGLRSGQSDALDIGAIASYSRAAVQAADTLYGWSKIKVEHSGQVAVLTDRAALVEQLTRPPEASA